MSDTGELNRLGEQLVAAMSHGDLPALLGLLHSDVEIHEPASLPYGGVRHGHDGFAEVLQIMAALVELEITDHTLYAIPAGVILVLDVRFISRSTGASFETRVVEIDTVDAGKVRTMNLFYEDTHALLEFLGWPAGGGRITAPCTIAG
jgi:uncharacterized protein